MRRLWGSSSLGLVILLGLHAPVRTAGVSSHTTGHVQKAQHPMTPPGPAPQRWV